MTDVKETAVLMAVNGSSHLASHLNTSAFHSSFRIGRILSVSQRRHLERDVSRPMSFCTSFKFCGLLMATMVAYLSRLASMPRSVSMKPKNFLPPTPKTHLARFNLMLNLRKLENVSSRSKISDLTIMSSTHTSMLRSS